VSDGVCDLVVAGRESVDLGWQGGDARAGGGVVHGAVLDYGEVPVDRGLVVLDLGRDGAGFGEPGQEVRFRSPRLSHFADASALRRLFTTGRWISAAYTSRCDELTGPE